MGETDFTSEHSNNKWHPLVNALLKDFDVDDAGHFRLVESKIDLWMNRLKRSATAKTLAIDLMALAVVLQRRGFIEARQQMLILAVFAFGADAVVDGLERQGVVKTEARAIATNTPAPRQPTRAGLAPPSGKGARLRKP